MMMIWWWCGPAKQETNAVPRSTPAPISIQQPLWFRVLLLYSSPRGASCASSSRHTAHILLFSLSFSLLLNTLCWPISSSSLFFQFSPPALFYWLFWFISPLLLCYITLENESESSGGWSGWIGIKWIRQMKGAHRYKAPPEADRQDNTLLLPLHSLSF